MDDDITKKADYEIGMVLDALSVDELQEKIAMLKGEIARLENAIENKTQSKSAADAVFKF
ncbi:DUF1192 domain-containing protein [Pelagibacterium lentulum]|uniref:DUF1192 domain-containing protein n=1 Tax=Pelagibacterium lentulum TaxID=2029865 RepID=A0A916W1B7_9HYPH|nr:DUF1192 domain-containing protein [Pelagibacterium lentulum]GGA58248.1 hypothetical protein GCM10011499_30520 [Pelagibacterium lentulum]